MATIESLTTAIRAALDKARDLLAGLAASKDLTESLRDQLIALGMERKAAQTALLADDLEAARAQATALADRLEAALAQVGTVYGAGGGPAAARPYPDGSFRTKDGKYSSSDGTSRSGAEAEAEAHRRFRARGLEVDAGQQHVTTPVEIRARINSGPRKGVLTLPAGRARRYDGAVKINGEWYGIETKGGTATKTPEQRAIDDWLSKPGNTLTTQDGKRLVGVREVVIRYRG
jgi:hypothetical protein